jgi:hypothetical protein
MHSFERMGQRECTPNTQCTDGTLRGTHRSNVVFAEVSQHNYYYFATKFQRPKFESPTSRTASTMMPARRLPVGSFSIKLLIK